MPQVLMEVLPNIHVANIYLTLPEISDSCRDIVVKKSECLIQFQSGREMRLQLPRGTCLVPDVERCVSQEGQVVTVRVQLDEMTSLINNLATDLLNDSDFKTVTPVSKILSNISLSGHCKLCDHRFFEGVKFQRVLPLPSVDWEHASEDWFCHIDKAEGEKLKPASLHPEEDECFYTELFFLLNCNLIKFMQDAKPDSGSDLKCFKCNLSLGMLMESCKVWTHNLVWKNEEGDTVHRSEVSTIMLTLFGNIDKDNFGVNCRLVLQLSSVPRRYLYMVTMNTNQKLLISSDGSQLLLTGKNEKNDCETEVTEEECVAAKRARVNGRSEQKLQAVFGVKLLYAEKEGDDDESGEWADNVHVHLIPCSDSFFTEVKSLLETTNSCLPENIKFAEKMKVGYIIK